MTVPENIAFIDLKAQREALGLRVDQAVARVLDHGAFIMGPEVGELEKQLSAFCGAKHVISCANGTDALTLALMAENIGSGDAVFVPAFTFVATAEVVAAIGASPVFVDVDRDSYNLCVESLKRGIMSAKKAGLKPRMIIPVDMFGLPADYAAIVAVAKSEGLIIVADSAQGFGGEINGRRTGTFGDYTTTSFFPAKPLGCYGDGGAVFTDDDDKAEILRSLRVHGKGRNKYDNVRVGMNSRLDTVQASILIEKLRVFDDEIVARNFVADRYNSALSDHVKSIPIVPNGYRSCWAQYTIKVENRAEFQASLSAAGVPSAVYYPIPMSKQSGYARYPVADGGVSVSEEISGQVVSLPMHPYLQKDVQDYIADTILTIVK